MKFGKIDDTSHIDFTLPKERFLSKWVLNDHSQKKGEFYMGYPSWNPTALPGFYEKGALNHLKYYADRLNSVELNATYYKTYDPLVLDQWRQQVNQDFRFFPKIHRYVSHVKRINPDIWSSVEEFCDNIRSFGTHLGGCFLQMPDNYTPKYQDRLFHFVEKFPKDIRLQIELRHVQWFEHEDTFEYIGQLFSAHQVGQVIVDTHERRDVLHMRLTTDLVMIRFVASNNSSDFSRLQEWSEILKRWINQGVTIYFFIHQDFKIAKNNLVNHLNNLLRTNSF